MCPTKIIPNTAIEYKLRAAHTAIESNEIGDRWQKCTHFFQSLLQVSDLFLVILFTFDWLQGEKCGYSNTVSNMDTKGRRNHAWSTWSAWRHDSALVLLPRRPQTLPQKPSQLATFPSLTSKDLKLMVTLRMSCSSCFTCLKTKNCEIR